MGVALTKHTELVNLLEELAPATGVFDTSIPGVGLIRTDDPIPRTSFMYTPRIMVVAQGRKRVWLGDDSFDYDADNYLVLAAPMPMECETMPGPDGPLLGVTIDIDATIVGEMILEIDDHSRSDGRPAIVASTKITEDVLEATTRLATTLRSPLQARVLGPQIVREIIFHVLTGEKGNVLRILAVNSGRHGQIARALRRIHEDYATDLDVASLAKEAHMGTSTFHQAFREMTATSPIQYIKQTRLHQARRLLVGEGVSAQQAAYQVGYASPSQFGREYRRLFGVSPASDKLAVA